MGVLRSQFASEKYSEVYEIDVPWRQGRFVVDTLERIAEENGIDALIAHVETDEMDGQHWTIGVAVTDPKHYRTLIQGLDTAIYRQTLDDIEQLHGRGHPMMCYLRQLERNGAADDATRTAIEELVAGEKNAAIGQAWRDWNDARQQWDDAPTPQLPG